MKVKKIGEKVKKIYRYHGHLGETYEPDRDESYLFSLYEDEDGNKFEKNEGRMHVYEDENEEKDSNNWINEPFTG